jgi:hypothetical protein
MSAGEQVSRWQVDNRAPRFAKEMWGIYFGIPSFILVHLRSPSFHVQKISEI